MARRTTSSKVRKATAACLIVGVPGQPRHEACVMEKVRGAKLRKARRVRRSGKVPF